MIIHNIIICHTTISPTKRVKVFRQSKLTDLFYHDILYLFWVYDLFTFYKYMTTMPISDVSLQKHWINVIFGIQRFYKGILSNHNNERSHSEQVLDRNIRGTGLKWPYNVLKMAYNAFISDCHLGSNLIVLLCYSHILCQGLRHCLWLPLNWYY